MNTARDNVSRFPVEKTRVPAYVDAAAVAEYLGMARSTIYAMAERDEIPHFRIGRRVTFRLDEIDRWMASQRHGPEV